MGLVAKLMILTCLACISYYLAATITLKGFTGDGWDVMRVITVATFLLIFSRLIPRRTS
jgi:hypothetical protein